MLILKFQKTNKKGGWQKGKKRKKLKDRNAPKPALSGYIRFLNERREVMRKENPNLTFSELTRLLGSEWTKLQQHEKQVRCNLALPPLEYPLINLITLLDILAVNDQKQYLRYLPKRTSVDQV